MRCLVMIGNVMRSNQMFGNVWECNDVMRCLVMFENVMRRNEKFGDVWECNELFGDDWKDNET